MTNPLHIFDGLRNGLAIRNRLEWLENRIFWIGELNRSDLVNKFSISAQQASSDIRLYLNIAPENLAYDPSKKQYLRGATFKALFEKNVQNWLAENEGERDALRSIQRVAVRPIQRLISEDVMRLISRSYRQRMPLAVLYQSMKSATPQWRTICPHAVVETDIRWHIRAWLSEKRVFADVVPSRILNAKEAPLAEWIGGEADSLWNDMQDIVLVPSKYLSESQRRIVESDYQMMNGRLTLITRQCLIYYQLSTMYLVDAVRQHGGDPIEKNLGLAVENWEALLTYVKD